MSLRVIRIGKSNENTLTVLQATTLVIQALIQQQINFLSVN